MKRPFLCLALATLPAMAGAQDLPDRRIVFPDVPGYFTLKCDLHIHTVFSDGSVWPDIRVREALADGLDAISLTEHLEYQPHSADIPHPDRNRSFEVASETVKGTDLMLIHGAEVTRDMPPGHLNAVFIDDANAFLLDDPFDVLREAKRQGAFVFWDHPNWTGHRPDGLSQMTEMHRQMIDEGLILGVEVVNDLTYSDETLQMALDNGLTILGTSDIHGLVDWRYEVAMGGHRSISLVFAEERTPAAIQEALVAGRTVAVSRGILAGKEEHLRPLVLASITTAQARYPGETSILSAEIENSSSATYLLRSVSELTFHNSGDVLMLPPRSTTLLQIKTGERLEKVELEVEVLNAVIAPRTHPRVVLEIPVSP